MDLDKSLYLAWLIPSSFSFASSCTLIVYILYFKPNLRSQLFHQLTIMLAGCWFIGPKYGEATSYDQCALQEYMLQLGLMLRALIGVIISSVATFVVKTRKTPSHKSVMKITVFAVLIPVAFIFYSIFSFSARLYCNIVIPKYKESSRTTQKSIIAYWVVAVAFVYICAAINIFLLSRMQLTLNEIRQATKNSISQPSTSIDSASMPIVPSVNKKMLNLVHRLRIYPLIFLIFWIPDAIALLTILITGTDQLVLRHIANSCGGSIGLATSFSYFYYQEQKFIEGASSYGSVFNRSSSFFNRISLNFNSGRSTSQATRNFESENDNEDGRVNNKVLDVVEEHPDENLGSYSEEGNIPFSNSSNNNSYRESEEEKLRSERSTTRSSISTFDVVESISSSLPKISSSLSPRTMQSNYT